MNNKKNKTEQKELKKYEYCYQLELFVNISQYFSAKTDPAQAKLLLHIMQTVTLLGQGIFLV